MRKWGIVITAAYAAILVAILSPFGVFISGAHPFGESVRSMYAEWIIWLEIAVLVAGEALLLFLSVDKSRERMKPQTHILVSCLTGAMLFGVMTVAGYQSVVAAMQGDSTRGNLFASMIRLFGAWGLLWLMWGIVLFIYLRNSVAVVTRIISWLLRGSVLELLVAVPCHVIVRRRDYWCAPAFTAFGIATGIAIMLLSFGPGVLFLYKKRLDSYSRPVPAVNSPRGG